MRERSLYKKKMPSVKCKIYSFYSEEIYQHLYAKWIWNKHSSSNRIDGLKFDLISFTNAHKNSNKMSVGRLPYLNIEALTLVMNSAWTQAIDETIPLPSVLMSWPSCQMLYLSHLSCWHKTYAAKTQPVKSRPNKSKWQICACDD